MYSEQFRESLALVEASREKNIALDVPRMMSEEKQSVLSSFHPDYKEDEFSVLKIGANKGDKVPRELAEILQAHSRISSQSVCLEKPDYVTDVLVIGGGGAGASAAIEAHKAGADVIGLVIFNNYFTKTFCCNSSSFLFSLCLTIFS